MKTKCFYCGAEMDSDAIYCKKCGGEIQLRQKCKKQQMGFYRQNRKRSNTAASAKD